MEVAAEDEIGVSGEEAFGGAGVGEVGEWVMQQDDAETGERVAGIGGEVSAELIFSEEEMAFIGIVATEPGGVEADNVDGQGMAGELDADAVTEAVRGKSGALQCVFDPSAVIEVAIESGTLPCVVKAEGRAMVKAVHPTGNGKEIAGCGERHAHFFPGLGFDGAVDVVIAGDDEEAVGVEVEFGEEGSEEGGGLVEFVGKAKVGGVAGEKDEVEFAFFVEEGFEISLPGLTENAAETPGFFLAGTFAVEVGEVQKFEGVLAESHGSTCSLATNG